MDAIELNLSLGDYNNSFLKFCESLIRTLDKTNDDDIVELIFSLKKEINQNEENWESDDKLKLRIAKNVILDFIPQGWRVFIKDKKAFLFDTLESNTKSPSEEKVKIRTGLIFQRDQQLQEKSVREFISRCERQRLTPKGWKSIYSLMRDGKELSERLFKISQLVDEDQKLEKLQKAIKPYIQFAESDLFDEHTGFSTMEIWRYFRHTWVTPYKVLPGRSIAILIRDAAAENHPVIGIAALASPVVQFTIRDQWIGWEAETFIENLFNDPRSKDGKHLLLMLSNLIRQIYIKDLIDEGTIDKNTLQNPSQKIIRLLREKSEEEIRLHRESADHEIFNKQKQNKIHTKKDWQKYAETSLYRSKRYRLLSSLLSIRYTFNKYGFRTGNRNELSQAGQFASFRKAVGQLVRRIKSENVGINMMDINICGAIAPYNSILGGKLVCSLLFSPEIGHYYKNKYSDGVSIIASSMQGKKVLRSQDLVFLGTTSLYRKGSSQYNRIRIPASEIGSKKDYLLEYYNLGKSQGFGSNHFSKDTVDYIHVLVGRRKGGRRVNSIFGEGANPLLRKIREGLDIVGFPSQKLLNHKRYRVTYAVALAENLREVLLNYTDKIKYLIPQTRPKHRTELLGKYWMKRWLLNRINRKEVLEEVANHTLEYPVTHGARVPEVIVPEEETLFSSPK